MPLCQRIFQLALAAVLLAWLGLAAAQPTGEVVVVLGEHSQAHLEVLDTLRKSLSADGKARVRPLSWYQLQKMPRNADLVVGIGDKAANALESAKPDAPLLLAMVSRPAVDKALSSHKGLSPVSAIYAEQPPGRQVELMRLALPGTTRFAILGAGASQIHAAALSAAAKDRKLLATQEIVDREEDLYTATQRVMARTDWLVALPELSAFDSRSLQNLMLTTFRARVPVLGASPDTLRQGDTLALYSTPRQIGAQLAEMSRQILAGSPLPRPQYPRQFEVSVNRYVAGSMGLALEEPESLRDKLLRTEPHQ